MINPSHLQPEIWWWSLLWFVQSQSCCMWPWKPYPEGTSVIINSIYRTVILIPILPFNQGLPDFNATQFYTIRLSDNNILTTTAPEMPFIIPTTTFEALPLAIPAWICSNHKVLYRFNDNYTHSFLWCSDNNTWHFEMRYWNRDIKSSIDLPDLTRHYQHLIDTGTLIPGWLKTPKVICGSASYISARNLTKPCPGTLAKAFNLYHPNKDTWMASYKDEYNSLLAHDTFTIIDTDKYHMIRKQTGKQAIPSMGVLTIKPDGHGNPDQAKSCIVVLGNHETAPWS